MQTAAAAPARAQPNEDKDKTMAPTTRKIKGYGWRPDLPEFASRDGLRTDWKMVYDDRDSLLVGSFGRRPARAGGDPW
jgi:hypothetical protein